MRPRWPLLLSVAAILLFFAALQLVAPADGFFSGDQGAKYLQTLAFAEQGPFNPGIRVASADLDPQYEHQILENRGGQLVGVFTWLLPLLSEPFFALLGMRGLYVVPAFAAVAIFLACAWLGRLLSADRGTPNDQGLGVAWAAVLCAPVLVYGAEIWEHEPAAAAVTIAACLLAPVPGRLRPASALLAGVAIGVAAIFREEAGLALAALLFARYRVLPREARVGDAVRIGLLTVAGVAITFALSVPLNLSVYRSALPLHLTVETGKMQARPPARLSLIADYLLPDRARLPFLAALVFGFVASLRFVVTRARVWLYSTVVSVLVVLAIGALLPLGRLIVLRHPTQQAYSLDSIAHTWTFGAALMLLPLVGRINRVVARYAIIAGLIMTAGSLMIVPSIGGAQWSPRYLFVAAPLLAAVAALPAFARPAGVLPGDARIVKWTARLALACAFAMQVDGLRYVIEAKARNARITRRLAELTQPGDVVITDIAWFAQVNAQLLPTRRILMAWSPDQIAELAELAVRKGMNDVALAVSLPETQFAAPRVLGGPVGGCQLTRNLRQDLGERGLVLHRYGCSDATSTVK
ncbi:MAG TPA: hypothetical protein VFZ98_11995 [Vicinamibacterales bacterium]